MLGRTLKYPNRNETTVWWPRSHCPQPVKHGVEVVLVDASYSKSQNFGFILDIRPNNIEKREKFSFKTFITKLNKNIIISSGLKF